MAKLILLAAALAPLLLLTHASIYRTIITTIADESNPGGHQSKSCSERVKDQDLRQCQEFLKPGSDSERHRMPCCRQLRELGEDCKCEGLQYVVNKNKGELKGEELKAIKRRAASLPVWCRLGTGCYIDHNPLLL